MKNILSIALTILLSTQVLMANEESTQYFHCYAQKITVYSGAFHLVVAGPFNVPVGSDYILTGVRRKTAQEIQRSIQENIRENQQNIADEDYDLVNPETNVNPIIEQSLRRFDQKNSLAAYHQALIKAQICPQEELDIAK